MSIQVKTRELIEAIMATKEFGDLKQAKEAIDKNSTLKNFVDDFKKKQAPLYSGKLTAKDAEAKIAELNKAYAEMSRNPEIELYFKAAKKCDDMLTGIYNSIGEFIEAKLR